MARAVARLGHDVSIFTTDREMEARERPAATVTRREGVEVHVYPQQFPATVATSWPLYRALNAAIPQADIVHIHSLYLFHVWAAARLARKHGVPYLLRPHGTLDPFLWQRHRARKRVMELLFQDRVIRSAAALHYTAEEEMRLAAPYVHNAKGVVVPNGLDLAEYGRCRRQEAFARITATSGRAGLSCSSAGSISRRDWSCWCRALPPRCGHIPICIS